MYLHRIVRIRSIRRSQSAFSVYPRCLFSSFYFLSDGQSPIAIQDIDVIVIKFVQLEYIVSLVVTASVKYFCDLVFP